MVVEPEVAELVEASKPPSSLAFSYGRFDALTSSATREHYLKIDFRGRLWSGVYKYVKLK